jgi:hypothetical protein
MFREIKMELRALINMLEGETRVPTLEIAKVHEIIRMVDDAELEAANDGL